MRLAIALLAVGMCLPAAADGFIYGVASKGDRSSLFDEPSLGVGLRYKVIAAEIHTMKSADHDLVRDCTAEQVPVRGGVSSCGVFESRRSNQWGFDVVAVPVGGWISPTIGIGYYRKRIEYSSRTDVCSESRRCTSAWVSGSASESDVAGSLGLALKVPDRRNIYIVTGWHSERDFYVGAGARIWLGGQQ